MSELLDAITVYLLSLAQHVPLEIFAFLGSVVEEIIAPIPSPVVMTLAGSIANAQARPLVSIAWLALFGATGKTLGAWVLYLLADKAEDILIGRFGKYIGVGPQDIEQIGKRLNRGWQDNVFLLIARALPVLPSTPISLACGIIKINLTTYLTSTFAGTYIRDLIYLYLGYVGLQNYREISHSFESFESIGQLVLFVMIAGVVVWAYLQRRKFMRTPKESQPTPGAGGVKPR